MHVLSRLITGGLVGFAIVLAVLGHSMWIPHVFAAGVSVLAVLFASVAMHQGRRAGLWHAVPFVAAVVVYFVAWF
ncbi:hypothetical protein [Corynebacterium urogenitale]